MKEQDVAALASLLKVKPEEVSSAIENGGISNFVEEFKTGHEVFTKDEFGGLKTNLKKSLEDEMLSGQIPKPIYDRVKGTVLEMTEKTLATKHGVDSFNGMEDLVNKIVESKAKNPEDVNKLKSRIDELVSAHEQDVHRLKTENNNRFVNLRLNEFVNQLDIDAEGARLDNQRKMVAALVRSEFDFDVDEKDVFIKKAPIEFKEKNLDPRPVFDVIKDFAKDYVNVKSPAGGGRGDGSSTSRNTLKQVDIKEYMEKNGIKPNSVELFKAIKKFEADGVEII